MRRWVLVISVVLLAAWVTAPVIFPDTTQKGLRAMSGEISAIDTKALTMTLRNDVAGSGVEEVDFIVDPAATIRVHGLRGRLSQLKVGDFVTVRYLVRDRLQVAMEIQHS